MKNEFLLLIAFSLAITACGGGGGGSSDSSSNTSIAPTPVTPTPSVPTIPTNPVTPNVPTLPTATTITKQDVLDYLNNKRNQCGFGNLTYNTELEKASTNHANYLGYISLENGIAFSSHTESEMTLNGSTLKWSGKSNPYYSGNDGVSRISTQNINEKATAVAYKASLVDENIAVSKLDRVNQLTQNSPITPINQLNKLLAAPYHLSGLVSPKVSEMGIGINSSVLNSANYRTFIDTLVMVSASPATRDFMNYSQKNSVLTFPCEGTTDTEYELLNEVPNPILNRDLSKNPIGQPIYILAPSNKTISNVTATIAVGNEILPTPIILTATTDPNKILSAYEAFIIPSTSLVPATKYSVNYTLSFSDGSNYQSSFSFTTKAK